MYLFDSKIPEHKSVIFALTYIYGINQHNAFLICKKLGFFKNFKIQNLSKDQLSQLLKIIESEKLVTGSNLKKINQLIFKKLVSIKSYRGLRMNQGLPARGQRTHTNAKTSRKQKFY